MGKPYPAPPAMQFAASVVFMVQVALWAVLFVGEAIFDSLKIPLPGVVKNAQENKMMSFMTVWLVGNMISAQLVNTGAFEIHHGDQLIWSSLQEKRLPNMADLMQAFAKTGVEFMQSHQDQGA
eukprot:gb/GFBE01068293.1/.p1 GENE.gb/GFBE01068293.1/~~gb/GFBE01068293.1/.p1  ORF type:complete len:123 (+),score=35.24 gb/GFBE01068293.1/:1-369(+)